MKETKVETTREKDTLKMLPKRKACSFHGVTVFLLNPPSDGAVIVILNLGINSLLFPWFPNVTVRHAIQTSHLPRDATFQRVREAATVIFEEVAE